MMFDRSQIGARNALRGRHGLWQARRGPRCNTMMPRNFPSHPHVTTPSRTAGPQGSTGTMAEVVDTRQGQELDQELVRRVQRGDSAAFDLLVRKYRSEEHTSEIQAIMRISYAGFC